MEPMLDIRQVAQWLGVSTYTVRREVERGQLTKVKVGRLDRFRRLDVEAYLASHEAEPLPPPQERPMGQIRRFQYVQGMKVV